MLGRAGTRGWTAALCLLALLPSTFSEEADAAMPTASESPSSAASSTALLLEPRPPTPPPSIPPSGNTSLHPVAEESHGTTTALPEPAANTSVTSELTSVSATGTTPAEAQTTSAVTYSPTPNNTETPPVTPKPSMFPGTVSIPPDNSTSPEVPLQEQTSLSPATDVIKGEIQCTSVKDANASHGVCLRLNKTTSCEDFRRDNGEALAQVLCTEEPMDRPCAWQFAKSEVTPDCLLLLAANQTDLLSKFQVLRRYQSDLRKLGIYSLTEEDVGSHQSHSRKTLIALVTAGLLLAVLGLAGYFLMNRRSWSPAGERLGEDPYFTENGGGPGASPERQPKAAASRGAQENGQPPPRNGRSAPHPVADTEL